MHFDVDKHTIFLAVTGSHAYGMARPTSDVDIRGAVIPPRKVRDSFYRSFEQFTSAKQDGPWGPASERAIEKLASHETAGACYARDGEIDLCVYSVTKLVALAANNNPNVLELLFLDDRDVLFSWADVWDRIGDGRDLFLSKRCRHSYTGYAMSQLKRIKGHRQWLLNPPKAPPTRAEYDLPEESVLPADVRNQIDEAVKKIVARWRLTDGFEDLLEGPVLDSLVDRMRNFHATLLMCEDDLLDEKAYELAGASIGLSKDVLYAIKQERRYRAALKHWQQYKRWKTERNEARAELEAKYGYDCYLDDTEFLTQDKGWCRYDEIGPHDMLATFNQETGRIEYQDYTERVAKTYDGPVGVVHARHTRCAVTMNHRMWVSAARRSRANGYSSEYVAEDAEWRIEKMGELVEQRRSHFHFRVTATPSYQEYEVEDEYLELLGAYVSEGCVGKRLKEGGASVLRISQAVEGDLTPVMDRLERARPEWNIRKFSYLHDEDWRTEPCQENVWTVARREVAARLESECGAGSENKRLPVWTRHLSIRQARLLLDVMVKGDGTERKHSRIYYTSSRRLADDVQAMCVHAGIVSHVWGPYEPDGMFQVYLGPRLDAVTVQIREGGSQCFEVQEVSDARIVCFTVPNEILVTRRHGKVAIQGNTKHASHLIRLLRTGLEILRDHTIRVRRPDAEELMAIRDGRWSYDELMEQAEGLQVQIAEEYETSTLRKSPDVAKIDALLLSVLESSVDR